MANVATPVFYPFWGPVVSGTNITVSTLLAQPTRITRYLSDLSLRGFISSRIFSSPGGGVQGGAVVYDQLTLNDLFSTRDVQNVEPGAEFPIVTSDSSTPLVASVEKYGGKFFITDEARDRNDQGIIQREGRNLINTIMRKTDQKAVATLDAAILGSQTAVGANWNTVVTSGASATSAAGWPAADIAKVQLLADQAELGVQFDLWIVNPAQRAQFGILYGSATRDVLASYGVEMIASNRVAPGTAYVVEQGQPGEMRLEKPLTTETWREQAAQRTWVQSDIRPVMYVTNPYSVAKITGLAG